MITLSRSAIAIALTFSLSACGGGGAANDGPFEKLSPIAGVAMADITDRTGAQDGEAKSFDTASAIGLNTSNDQARKTVGTITFRSLRELGDGQVVDPGVEIVIDTDGDGIPDASKDTRDGVYTSNYNPTTTEIRDETGQPRIQVTSTTLGNDQVVKAADIPDYNNQTIVYVPADSAQNIYAGMAVHAEQAQGASGGAVGIFGQKITSTELSAQNGSAVGYKGIASAIVAREPGTSPGEGGLYEGQATATVNFGTNQVTTSSTLSRTRTIVNPGNVDTINYSSTATYAADGSITGTSSFDGLASGGSVSGSFDGQIYGPNADTIGGTFEASGTNVGVAGGLLVDRLDD